MYQYYLAQVGDAQRKLIRDMPENLLSFSVYEPEKENWDNKFGTFWADKILMSGFDAYEEISEKEAIRFIKEYQIRKAE